MTYIECDSLDDWDGFPEVDPEPDGELTPCQCEYCPCTNLVRYGLRCADCVAGVHQG